MAIAFDAASGATTGSGQTLTWSHTCTGSNLILIVGAWSATGSSAEVATGVTYNGVAMTFVDNIAPQANWDHSLWYLIAPATGANNVVVTFGDNSPVVIASRGVSLSYTGAKQSGQPDAIGEKKSPAGSATPFLAVTTIAANCWLIGTMFAGSPETGVGSGTTDRYSPAGSIICGADSGAAIASPSSYTLNFTQGAADSYGLELMSIAPAVAAGPTNLKTYNTNAAANIKTMNTNAIANVKTFDTNA